MRHSLSTLAGDRTILVIAHRTKTDADADIVVVLENGLIVECGRPTELLARSGKFAEFWRSHRSASTDGIEAPVLQGDELRGFECCCTCWDMSTPSRSVAP